MVWAMTLGSSPKISSGEAEGKGEGEGVRDSSLGVSGGRVLQGSRSGE